MSRRNEVLRLFNAKHSYMEDRIKAGIEANRKGDAFLHIVDGKGEAVKDAVVKVVQKSHDFKYGANLFMLDEFQDEEKNGAYRKIFSESFNIATLPFYWKDLEPEPGKYRFSKESPRIYRRPVPDLCLEYCEANGIEPKAHCLNYAVIMPEWAKGTLAWEKKCLNERFRTLAERYAGRIPMWEVTNETFWTSPLSTLYRQPEMVEYSFALAEKYFPANKLIINEAHIKSWSPQCFLGDRSPFYMQIERALLKGARIDGIGMQYHMFYPQEKEAEETRPYYDPEQLFAVMDAYDKLNLPMHLTEITIPAYSNDPEDEALQAEIIRNLYRIWFSHRAMEGIIYWNLVDGYGYGAEPGDMSAGENSYYGGLLRFDMSPKPAFKVIRELFDQEWRTNLELHTASGDLSFRGFYGSYDIEVTAAGKRVNKTIHLNKHKYNNFTINI
ncbi:MAG: glycoside hydrolase family 10 [Lentisphaerae bacterium]|nr:glycoside hydrolase family 10 [Lentisphaerota bacterium]